MGDSPDPDAIKKLIKDNEDLKKTVKCFQKRLQSFEKRMEVKTKESCAKNAALKEEMKILRKDFSTLKFQKALTSMIQLVVDSEDREEVDEINKMEFKMASNEVQKFCAELNGLKEFFQDSPNDFVKLIKEIKAETANSLKIERKIMDFVEKVKVEAENNQKVNQRDLQMAKDEVQKLSDEVAKTKSDLKESYEANSSLKKEVQKVCAELNGLKEFFHASPKDFLRLMKEIKAKTANSVTVERKIMEFVEKMKIEVDNNQTIHEMEFQIAKEEIQRLSDEVSRTKSDLKDSCEVNSRLGNEVATLKAKETVNKETLEFQIRMLGSGVDLLKAQISNIVLRETENPDAQGDSSRFNTSRKRTIKEVEGITSVQPSTSSLSQLPPTTSTLKELPPSSTSMSNGLPPSISTSHVLSEPLPMTVAKNLGPRLKPDNNFPVAPKVADAINIHGKDEFLCQSKFKKDHVFRMVKNGNSFNCFMCKKIVGQRNYLLRTYRVMDKELSPDPDKVLHYCLEMEYKLSVVIFEQVCRLCYYDGIFKYPKKEMSFSEKQEFTKKVQKQFHCLIEKERTSHNIKTPIPTPSLQHLQNVIKLRNG